MNFIQTIIYDYGSWCLSLNILQRFLFPIFLVILVKLPQFLYFCINFFYKKERKK